MSAAAENLLLKMCPVCGKVVPTTATGRQIRKYCSSKCQRTATARRYTDGLKAKPRQLPPLIEGKSCLVCESPVPGSIYNKTLKYCSVACRGAAKRCEKTCPQCNSVRKCRWYKGVCQQCYDLNRYTADKFRHWTYNTCPECKESSFSYFKRGVCSRCYSRHQSAGTLAQLRPRLTKREPGSVKLAYKHCGRCRQVKPIAEFYNSKHTLDGKQNRCKKCQLDGYNKSEQCIRESRLRKKYGISLAHYDQLHAQQEGLCAICKSPEKEGEKGLAVDHCHKTGQIRGLLCANCNRGIGLLQEDPTILTSALAYLHTNLNHPALVGADA